MTDTQKIARVKTLLGDSTIADNVVSDYLAIAKDTITGHVWQFGVPENTFFPPRYEPIQCELAARYYARQGGGGEVKHAENGIDRIWDSPDDKDLLRKVKPIIKVV